MKIKNANGYTIRDREAGNYIVNLPTLQEAKDMLSQFEEEDKCNGIYEENFYEIYDENEKKIVY